MLLIVAVSMAAISFGQTKQQNVLTVTRADTPQGVGFYITLTNPADTDVTFGCNLYIFGTNNPEWQSSNYYLRANFSKNVRYEYVQTNIPTDVSFMVEVPFINGCSEKYEYVLGIYTNTIFHPTWW